MHLIYGSDKPGSGNEFLKKYPHFPAGAVHTFRMPLNADEGELSVYDGLRHAVRRALNDGEPFAGV